MPRIITQSVLVFNKRGAIYHLDLKPEDIADTIICVGDQDRVKQISKYFDSIELKKRNREFVTHTGYLNKKRITALSTGIGTDNVDIVLTELDALVNIDFKERRVKKNLRSLDIIRIGTTGALQNDIPVDSFIISEYAIGLDDLLHWYKPVYSKKEKELLNAFNKHMKHVTSAPYVAKSSLTLFTQLKQNCIPGITVTCSGFFGAQGRLVRAKLGSPQLLNKLQMFSFAKKRITNIDMETSGIYGLGKILGHHCCTIDTTIINRMTGDISKDSAKSVDRLIQMVLQKI